MPEAKALSSVTSVGKVDVSAVTLGPSSSNVNAEVIFAVASADLAELRAAFPERRFYRLTYHAEGAPVRIRPIADRSTAAPPKAADPKRLTPAGGP